MISWFERLSISQVTFDSKIAPGSPAKYWALRGLFDDRDIVEPWNSSAKSVKRTSTAWRWRCGCGRGRWMSLSDSSISWGREIAAADAGGGSADERDFLRAAGDGEDDAGADRRWVYTESFRAGERGGRRREGGSARFSTRRRSASATRGQRTVLFLDEIHRFNRAQQDILLGDVGQVVEAVLLQDRHRIRELEVVEVAEHDDGRVRVEGEDLAGHEAVDDVACWSRCVSEESVGG